MKNLSNRLRGHFREYISRYAVVATAVLAPIAGALGVIAANLGGADTPAGRAALGGASAVGTALALVTFIRNSGIWQMLDQFGTAPGVPQAAVLTHAPLTGIAGTAGTDHPDEAMGADEEPALPVSPNVDRAADATWPTAPEQGGT